MNENRFSFRGSGENPRPEGSEGWQSLHRIHLDDNDDPTGYHTEDPGLITAVKTALTLGMPLLLTGDPGVGKTQLAYRIAYELGCGKPIFFPVKSASEAQDLFYHVDHLRRLHAAQVSNKKTTADDPGEPVSVETSHPHDPVDIRRFIHFQGLGLAILRALPKEKLEALGLWEHAWPESEKQEAGYGQRRPSVVLIDEIDKAPIDFPNDMLEEIRKLEFSVPELGTRPISLYADSRRPDRSELRFRPQIVITSNSEKVLPEPFLRRCVYYHIPFPSQQVLKKIIHKRLEKKIDSLAPDFQEDCLQFFRFLSEESSLEKRPSTGELLNWFLSLAESEPNWGVEDIGNSRWRSITGHCLLKTERDQSRLNSLFKNWKPGG